MWKSLVASLSETDRELLQGRLRRRTFRRGEVVFHRGDPGDTLHVVRRGRLKIATLTESGEEAILTVLGPDDLFGEITLLDGGPRSATVVALEEVETATLSRRDFLDLLRSSPGAVEAVLAAMAGTIRRLSDEVADLMYLDLRGRLAKKLTELAAVHGSPPDDGWVEIVAPLTQEELAGLIGATRPRVNALLGFFEDQQALSRRGRRIAVRPAELQLWGGEIDD